jgi:hypothetical protein
MFVLGIASIGLLAVVASIGTGDVERRGLGAEVSTMTSAPAFGGVSAEQRPI